MIGCGGLCYYLNNRCCNSSLDTRTINVPGPPGCGGDSTDLGFPGSRRFVVSLEGGLSRGVVLVVALLQGHRPNTLGLERSEYYGLFLGLRRYTDHGLFSLGGTADHNLITSLRRGAGDGCGVVLNLLGRTGHYQGFGSRKLQFR